ncbi:MAG: signal peptide peptidase SppA [Deltaproteobacteria bacterium]|nr:signal peptide peptidase SppA [Deltaproteobacteria bacterium]
MRRFRRVVLLLAVVVFVIWLIMPAAGTKVAPGSILVLDLSGRFIEAAEPSIMGRLLGDGRRPFVSLLSELAKAQRDERLAGVVLRIRRLDVGWGMAQELHDAIAELGEAGRPTLAYLETGSLGANREYYIATAADEIVVSPGTSSPLIGLAMEYLFLGGLWEKLGAGVEAIGSGEYKSGAETISGRKMSEAHREIATALLDSTFAQFVTGIAEGRGLGEQFVRDAIDLAPVTPEELEGLGLVDAVASFDEATAKLGDGPLIESQEYAAVDPASVGFDPVARFALVYGSGTVVMGKGTMSPTGGLMLTSDSVSGALEQAAKDPEIRAIIFRVDSPGGSPLASDIIWRAAERAKRHGKPLIASVSNYAASGGYYVLCAADAVVAPAGSLVGSIGVFVMRPVIAGLLEKLGIGVESMTRGAHAGIMLSSQPLDEAGRERLLEEITALYDLFVTRVADGRGLAAEQVHEIGRGRVWTGTQAVSNGLVDELGGLRTAVRRAKREVGLDEDADVLLVPYPAPRSLAEELVETLRRVAVQAAPQLPGVVRRLEPLLSALPRGGPLLVPPFVVEIQ